MSDISFKAAYASVVEDPEEGHLFIGFAEGEDESENYALFRQRLTGGPVWFELGGDEFGAEDALASLSLVGGKLRIALVPALAPRFGYALSAEIGLDQCEDVAEALDALRTMLPGLWQEG